MQFAHAVHGAAVVCGGHDGGTHSAQVVVGHAGDAQLFKLCFGEDAGGSGGQGRSGHDGRHGIGQGLHFGHLVHIGGGQRIDAVAQQIGFGRAVDTAHADGGVVVLGGVGRRCGVGVVEDGVEAVHDGLHFGCGVGLRAGDVCVVQSVVDGG